MPSALKLALEDLLRHRRLQDEGPPLRGEDRPLAPLSTGVPTVDRALGGGLPRGQLSELHGPASSGRTALALCTVARCTARGALAAWVDPADRLEPASAVEAGVELGRLLWLRGEPSEGPRALMQAVSAVSTLVGSGVFELVVLDLAGTDAADLRRLPGSTWLRLQRLTENTPGVVLLLASAHVAQGPRGASVALAARGACWTGAPGPGRLLQGIVAEARAGQAGLLRAPEPLRLGALS